MQEPRAIINHQYKNERGKHMRTIYAKKGDRSYAFRLVLNNNDFYNLPFGRQLTDLRIIEMYIKKANTTHINCKGKAILASVKNWVKETKPYSFYCSWQTETSFYKDDVVQVYYIQ